MTLVACRSGIKLVNPTVVSKPNIYLVLPWPWSLQKQESYIRHIKFLNSHWVLLLISNAWNRTFWLREFQIQSLRMQFAAWSADCLQYRMKFKSKYKTQLSMLTSFRWRINPNMLSPCTFFLQELLASSRSGSCSNSPRSLTQDG